MSFADRLLFEDDFSDGLWTKYQGNPVMTQPRRNSHATQMTGNDQTGEMCARRPVRMAHAASVQ